MTHRIRWREASCRVAFLVPQFKFRGWQQTQQRRSAGHLLQEAVLHFAQVTLPIADVSLVALEGEIFS